MEGGQRIPPVASGSRPSHLDTHYLLVLLLGEDWDKDVFRTVHSLVTPPHPGSIEVSLVAVGEAFAKIATGQLQPSRSDRPPLARWARLVQEGSVTTCWADHHARQADFFDLAKQVKIRAPGVGPADCLIVASALACRACQVLYTTDRRLLTNSGLRRFCDSKKHGFRLIEAGSA